MMRGIGGSIVISTMLILCLSNSVINAESSEEVVRMDLEIIDSIHHEPTSFTQGLEKRGGNLLESSGLYGFSRLIEIDIQNGEVIRQISFDDSIFAEGITVRNNSVILLTWREGIAFEIDLDDFAIIGNYSYQGEGWGICYDGEYLVMSNGSSNLTFRDPESFEISHSIQVTFEGEEITNLNELECLGDTVYANVWMDDSIFAINSSSGMVEFFASASIVSEKHGNNPNEVLNGIAYDESADGFWITGKNWSAMYLVTFSESEANQNPNVTPITTSIFILAVGICLVWLIRPILPWTNDPETPNFKDHHQ